MGVTLRGSPESTTQTDGERAAPGERSSESQFAGPEATGPREDWPSHLFCLDKMSQHSLE